MLGNHLYPSASHSLFACQASDLKPTFPSAPMYNILLCSGRMVLRNVSLRANRFCDRLGARNKIWSSLRPAPRLSNSLLGEFYLQRQGPSRGIARATDEDGEDSDLGSGPRTVGRQTLLGAVDRLRITLQIYMVVWVYIFYFFGASAWDGKWKNK